MKKYFIIMAASILAAASCTKENTISENNIDVNPANEDLCGFTIGATNNESKTCIGTISENSISINWEEGDAVKVWDDKSGCDGHVFTMKTISEDKSNAVFTGEVHSLATNLNVVYPAANVSGNISSLSASIPATQTMKNGSFDSAAALSIAKTTRVPGQTEISGLEFQNLCAMISFSVPSYITTVTISANNGADIAGTATINCSTPAISSVSGSKTITVTRPGSTTAETAMFYAVIAPGTYTGGFTFNMTADNGATYSKSTTKELPATAGKIFKLGNLGLKLDVSGISIVHEYSNNVLQGSKITVNSSNDDKQKGLVKNWKVTLKKSGLDDQEFNLTSASASAGKYIPQGQYDATVEYSFADGSSRTENCQTTVPAPVISAAVSASTSYSKYKNGDISGANGCQADKIYGLTASVAGVSESVLKQSNVSSNVKSFIDGSEKSSTDSYSTSAGDFAGYSWAAHTIKGTATFDGVTASKEETVYITGLPYSVTTDKTDFGWTNTGSHNQYEGSERTYAVWSITSNPKSGQKNTSESYSISPAFNVPSGNTIKVSSKIVCYSYAGTITSCLKTNVYCTASTTNTKGTASSKSVSAIGLLPKEASWNELSFTGRQLTSSVNKICYCVSCTRSYSWSVCAISVGLYSKNIDIYYE